MKLIHLFFGCVSAFIVLLVLKLLLIITWSWGAVFSPLWIFPISIALGYLGSTVFSIVALYVLIFMTSAYSDQLPITDEEENLEE